MSDFLYDHDSDMLNEIISAWELVTALKSFHSGRAPRPDGIVVEMFKNADHILYPLLLKLFNSVLYTTVFLQQWCKSIICPLFNGGNTENTSDYRGILLLDVMGKIFTRIIANRLNQWAESHDKYAGSQNGYRTGRSTTDNTFTLMACAQKYSSKKKGRMYCLFIDFSSAFDRVQHKLLWYVLMKNGITGKFLQVIQSMYSQLQSGLKTNNGLSEYFDCIVGTKQGCMISPFMFILFINELITLFNNSNCQGIYIDEQVSNVCVCVQMLESKMLFSI